MTSSSRVTARAAEDGGPGPRRVRYSLAIRGPIRTAFPEPSMSRPSVDELVESWLTAHRQGVEVTVEQVCRDCPDLTDEVRRRVARAGHAPAPPGPAALGGYRVER